MKDRNVALVTGASSDLGRAIAVELASQGHDVVVHYATRAEEAAATAVAVEATGARSLVVEADLDDEHEVATAFQVIGERFGGVDVLVNNAARRVDSPLVTTRTRDWDAVMSTTVRAAFLCARAALPHMTKRRFGRIVNVASVAGLTGWPGQASYSTAKAALVGLTKTIAREYGSYGVTCNAVAPGLVETSGLASLGAHQREAIVARTMAGRAGVPDEVAVAVSLFASRRASYITGQVLAVDGGFSV